MTDPLAIWNSLCEFERDVLTGKKTGWGAALGQAIEVLQARDLFDAYMRPTRLGIAVRAAGEVQDRGR